jgi:hypothetical protein
MQSRSGADPIAHSALGRGATVSLGIMGLAVVIVPKAFRRCLSVFRIQVSN